MNYVFKRTIILNVLLAPLFIISVIGCEKSKDDKNDESAETTSTTTIPAPASENGPSKDDGGIPVVGTLALATSLTQNSSVTHVIALNTSTGKSFTSEVAADGTFSVNITADEPWVVSYVDSSKTGSEMIVSHFVSETLDTVSAAEDSTEVNMGTVDTSAAEATTTTSHDDLLVATGMTSAAAVEFGAVDDVSLRYLNPDIDGNGKLDAVEGVSFGLDFHNRFSAKTAAGDAIDIADLKNAFPPDDVVYAFTGSGISPWFDSALYGGTIDKYSWKFSTAATLGTNGGQVCEGYTAGTALPADTLCNLQISAGQSVAGVPGVELAAAVDGTYTLDTGFKTFTWTNVKVSDFSAGEGFLALFTKYDVDADEKLQSVSYKWMRKNSAGTYELATQEYLKLIVKGAKGYISLKVDGASAGKGIGVSVPGTPEGKVLLSDTVLVHAEGFNESEIRAGILWTRCLENPGVSYDDKLGMRFFF